MSQVSKKLFENVLILAAAVLVCIFFWGVQQVFGDWLSLAGNVFLLAYLIKRAGRPRFGGEKKSESLVDSDRRSSLPQILDRVGLLLVGILVSFCAWVTFRVGGEYVFPVMNVILYAALIQRAGLPIFGEKN